VFKTLYRCARMTARHENGPPALSRLAYLKHLAAGGATLDRLRANACVLYRAAVCMSVNDTSPVEPTEPIAHARFFQTAADPNGSDGLDLSATRSYLRDISVNSATANNQHLSRGTLRPFGFKPKGWCLSRGGNRSEHFRCSFYGENSGDSMHAEPHFGTSCHYQIFF
jgi:hypothetical protein